MYDLYNSNRFNWEKNIILSFINTTSLPFNSVKIHKEQKFSRVKIMYSLQLISREKHEKNFPELSLKFFFMKKYEFRKSCCINRSFSEHVRYIFYKNFSMQWEFDRNFKNINLFIYTIINFIKQGSRSAAHASLSLRWSVN